MSFIDQDLYLEVLGDGRGPKQSLYADYYKSSSALSVASVNTKPSSSPASPPKPLSSPSSPSNSAVNAVFAPKKLLPFKSAIKKALRKVSGDSFLDYDYYDNMSLKGNNPRVSAGTDASSGPHPYRMQLLATGLSPSSRRLDPPMASDSRGLDSPIYRESSRNQANNSPANKSFQSSRNQANSPPANQSFQSSRSRPIETNTYKSHPSTTHLNESSGSFASRTPVSQLSDSFISFAPSKTSSLTQSATSSISDARPPANTGQSLDECEVIPRFEALPLQEPEYIDRNSGDVGKKNNKLRDLFKRHSGDSESHPWWVTVSHRKQLKRVDEYRQGSEQMLMRWQKPEELRALVLSESDSTTTPPSTHNEDALGASMQLFSHVNVAIKRVKIMRIIFSPIDILAEQFPSLQSIVVIVELLIFGWILYEVSLLVDALCMTVKAVCSPVIAIGKFMNRIM